MTGIDPATPYRVGVLNSLTGVMADSERLVAQASHEIRTR
jgi:hypothetical protein